MSVASLRVLRIRPSIIRGLVSTTVAPPANMMSLKLSVSSTHYSTRVASLTDSPGWIRKMKERFAALDVDKNGVIDENDVVYLANKLATYRNRDGSVCKQYFDIFNGVFGVKGLTNEEQFVAGMKVFVSKPDATKRAHKLADMVFEVIDEDGNSEISFEEYYRFYKASSNMTEKMIRHLFHVADKNGDGVIQREEFQESTAKLLLSADYD